MRNCRYRGSSTWCVNPVPVPARGAPSVPGGKWRKKAYLQHLATLSGGKVNVTVEIEAEVPEGVSDDVRRAINENCQTRCPKSHGFEESQARGDSG